MSQHNTKMNSEEFDERVENILYDVFDRKFGVDESIDFIHDLVVYYTDMSPSDIDWNKVEELVWKVWVGDFSVDDAMEEFEDINIFNF